MMSPRCSYPNCRYDAMWTPVVEIPTMRTVGTIKPTLTPLVHDEALMRRAGLNRNLTIRNYENALADFKARVNQLSPTTKPTYLIGQVICHKHKANYNLSHWFEERDWDRLREAARSRGFELLPIQIMPVQFKPVGWLPNQKYMEVA